MDCCVFFLPNLILENLNLTFGLFFFSPASSQAFDMQRDLQITPRRLEYTREKEGELFTSLMAIANRKQEEMKEMIVETLGSMKEQLLEDAANLEFTGVSTRSGSMSLDRI